MHTRLILIRHGETDWNLQRRYCGFTDIDLNKKGRAQARRLSERLGKEIIDQSGCFLPFSTTGHERSGKHIENSPTSQKIHKVYSSDMKRTLEFARIVFKATPIKQLSELREMNFGAFESLRYQEIMDKYPEIYKKWLDNPLDVIIPQGESLNSLAKRVKKALAEILSRNNNRTVAIFTHAGPIRVILCDVLKLDLKDIWQIEPPLAGLTTIEFAKGKATITLLNDISHCNG